MASAVQDSPGADVVADAAPELFRRAASGPSRFTPSKRPRSYARAHFNPIRAGSAAAGPHFVRDRYSLFSVLIVITSPSTTKCGTWITSPVSSVAGFKVLVTAAVLIPGSVCTTFIAIVLGSVTLSGVVS